MGDPRNCGFLISTPADPDPDSEAAFAERRRQPAVAIAGCVLIAVVGVVGAIAVAGAHGLAPNGIGFTG